MPVYCPYTLLQTLILPFIRQSLSHGNAALRYPLTFIFTMVAM